MFYLTEFEWLKRIFITFQVSVANLLGVAGIDVPDTEFKRALLPHEVSLAKIDYVKTVKSQINFCNACN